MRSITCINNVTGVTAEFREDGFTPFFLAAVDGLYQSENNVFVSDNTMTDGSTYQGSIAKQRNIVLHVMDNPQSPDFVYNQQNRDFLYGLFRKGEQGTLIYTENGKSRKIEYHPEKIERATSGSRLFSISLICENPMFKDENDHRVSIANWIDDFEFLHEFIDEGEEFAHRSDVRLVNIVNDVATNGIGLTITITATGPVKNPVITHVETESHLQIGSGETSLYLERGDVVTITTSLNNKHVRLTSENITQEINQYLTEDSEFIQLMFGNNDIAYDAEEGAEFMVVDIKYAYEYEGA